MYSYLRVGISGLLISFLGALPLGILNITAFDIAATQNVTSALLFALAAIFVELAYVRLTLWGGQKINFGNRMAHYLIPLGIVFLMYLSISSFMNSFSDIKTEGSYLLIPKITSPILLGILLSALNPLQVPFWMTWSKVLENRGVLKSNLRSYGSYMAGIGIGTLIGLLVFIFAGKSIVANYWGYSQISNLILGIVYLGFSIYLLFLLYKKHLKLKIQ